MLAVSRALNPECEHVRGDMRRARLGRRFDAVFVHDAVMSMTSRADLRRVAETAFAHCEAGGAALFVPDALAETFREATSTGGADGEPRALRYLEWTWDPDPEDTTTRTDMAIFLREEDGSVRAVLDRLIHGLFPRETWVRTLERVGFAPRAIPFHGEGGAPTEIFVAARPLRGRGRSARDS